MEILGNHLDAKPEKIKQGQKGLNLGFGKLKEKKEERKKKEKRNKERKKKKEKEEKKEILHSLEIFIFSC